MGELPGLQGWSDVLLRLATAIALGGLIGVNRELHHKPAGLRTHALVSLGAATIMAVTDALLPATDRGQVTRAIQGIITGIGFVGAGAILHPSGQASVRGLTTAATIWIAACLGTACGAGLWVIATLSALLTFVVLMLGEIVEGWIHGTVARLRTRRERR